MTLAIIGGTGLTSLPGLEIDRREMVHTPFGEPSGPLTHGHLNEQRVIFLARHGYGHTIPPHGINYRANIWAMQQAGATCVLAVAAVGGISAELAPGTLAAPDQIIDYTWGRANTFFEQDLDRVTHVDFTQPYDATLRGRLLSAAGECDVAMVDGGCYGATQGPRLETAAEIRRLQRDGCDMVGMTGMPEAVLARELELPYTTCAVVANWAAGVHGDTPIAMSEIERILKTGMANVRCVLGSMINGF
ncbi:S-methyl-5'-thioinosine phosphorylase [wastewater metagenome]|uniref:S-methyl-5'-thioinosine phosphorylase n=2 Tax=unclassified sequences TaxID=12908 RepID=A0A5B8RBX4_9ZZZZ|nr:S-methyl-5'-thioinosine phosphorylase [Arhodomonas aquaeolei]MCS4503292.1 S-methyl-5'-thioinosine phosphorylase [Arhodomonas aquaeolei]QEA05583.1 S-methyl-5'-thioinosine phosphorylase [uncultured organism]